MIDEEGRVACRTSEISPWLPSELRRRAAWGWVAADGRVRVCGSGRGGDRGKGRNVEGAHAQEAK